MSEPTSEIPTTIDADLEVGARVGEYEVEAKIGQGAFGTVFKATHPLIGKVVAIKVLARKFSVDPEMVSRFTAEARAVNQIRNRHIIDIFSFGALEDGRQYYVMEYLDGEPLDSLLERRSGAGLPVADTLQILRGVARALDAAHGKGVAHRDLKAENIFLANDAEGSATGYWPKLLDFGIAKLMAPEDGLKHKTRTGAPIGTPYYMSPEQCRGRDVDHRTDIYAFGVLAYLMLTGVYPFDADDYMSILMKQITERQTAPSTHNADLTPEIDDVIGWMMNKDPSDRPPDLRTAVRALEQAATAAGLASATQWGGNETNNQTGPVAIPTQAINIAAAGRISSKSGNPVGDVSVPAQRRSKTAWIAGGLALALVAGVAIVFATRRSEPAQESRSTQHEVVPQPAPRPPAPAPAPPTVDAPQTVIVTIGGVPEGTEVFAGGMTVGSAPGPVQLPRDLSAMVLTFKADGFLTTSREVTPDRDQALDVTLKKKPGGKRKTKDDILDPFRPFGSKR